MCLELNRGSSSHPKGPRTINGAAAGATLCPQNRPTFQERRGEACRRIMALGSNEFTADAWCATTYWTRDDAGETINTSACLT